MDSEISMIKFNIYNYYSALMSSRPMYPITSLLIKLVDSLIESESEPDKKHHQRVMWLYKNTHEDVMQNIAIVELVVFRNLTRGLNSDVELNDTSYTLIELYKFLDSVILELTKIVVDIAKKYDISFPNNPVGKSSDIRFG